MKRIAATLVATMSLFGCAAENDGEGGGFLEGLRPAKPSLDDPKPPVVDVSPGIQFVLTHGVPIPMHGSVPTPDGGDISAETISVPFPVEDLCRACDVIVLRDARNPGELNLIDDHGHFVCRIWVAEDGHMLSTDCR